MELIVLKGGRVKQGIARMPGKLSQNPEKESDVSVAAAAAQ